MQIKKLLVLITLGFLFSCTESKETKEVNYYQSVELPFLVNPFIGTGGHGHTFPGSCQPFGMVQLSPDTRLDGWDGCGGYHYTDSIIHGFSHTHLSGTGVSDYGDILFMPTIRAVYNNSSNGNEGYSSPFKKQSEKAHAGYYKVALDNGGIGVELTTTARMGIQKYDFSQVHERIVMLDLDHRDKVLFSSLEWVDEHTLRGSRISKAWADIQAVHFYTRFNHPIKSIAFVNSKNSKEQSLAMGDTLESDFLVASISFADSISSLILQTAISAVDQSGAELNFNSENTGDNFDNYLEQNNKAWANQLAKIELEKTKTEKDTIFYTAMYHSFVAPNLFSDVDGRYRNMAGGISKSSKPNYTVFSLWDTYRATHPLFTLLEVERSNEFINTFLNQYKSGGALPIWELSGNYTGCMIGYHAIPVITDAYLKGINEFDPEVALEAMIVSAQKDHLGLESYKKKNYVDSYEEAESVSKTLEYAYDDWCIAKFAEKLAKKELAKEYFNRSENWKNLFDKESGFFRPRLNGGFIEPFDPYEVNFHLTEANSWQYSMYVPHQINELIKLHGGKESFIQFLDMTFSANSKTKGRQQVDITGLIGQYAHGNEPSHHMAYLYSLAGDHDKTAQKINEICTSLYENKPNGLSGNEDCGQMSSWYVLSSLGFYPVCPGSNEYVFGTPSVNARINFENENNLIIERSEKAEQSYYVSSIELNNSDYGYNSINHNELIKGGKLSFEVATLPQNIQLVNKSDMNSEQFHDDKKAPRVSPLFSNSKRSSKKEIEIAISSLVNEDEIFYLKGEGNFKERAIKYTKPITMTESGRLRAAIKNKNGWGPVEESNYVIINNKYYIRLQSSYAPQYSAGGDEALIDGIKGGDNFKTGDWQGYQGQDVVFEVDFGEEKAISSLSIRFLQDTRPWILLPRSLTFILEGAEGTLVKTLTHEHPQNNYEVYIKHFLLELEPKSFRSVKVIAESPGPLPSWHLGAGNKAWMFCDELEIN